MPSVFGDWQPKVEDQQMPCETEKMGSHAKVRFFVGTRRDTWGGLVMSCQRTVPKPGSFVPKDWVMGGAVEETRSRPQALSA